MALLDTFKQFNWLDIFVIILLLRIGYIAIKTGLPLELFKLLGTIVSVYLSLHYYSVWADFLKARPALKNIPLELLSFVSFIALVILGHAIFILLRSLFLRFLKLEAVANLNKWGGLLLGIARGILLASLIMFILVISNLGYPKNSVKNSYSGKYLLRVAPATYSTIWNNLASKFMTGEKFNEAIIEVQKELIP